MPPPRRDTYQSAVNMNAKTKTISVSGNTALVAAALQDHWCRSLSAPVTHYQNSVCRGLPRRLMLGKKDVKAVVDTGLRRYPVKSPGHNCELKEAKEYVLDASPSLSLAQKLGIVACPAKKLSENEWDSVKQKSNSRQDSNQPCVICKENYGASTQVLLSCSHVFHKECLQAFERFSGQKTCPMCRHHGYQTRVIHEGKKIHYSNCAIIIQAAWRGYVVRCWYQRLRQTTPPNNPLLRKRFFEKKLQDITDRTVTCYDTDIDSFLAEIDQSIATHRLMVNSYTDCYIGWEEWEYIKYKALQRGDLDCPICVTPIILNTTEDNRCTLVSQDLDLTLDPNSQEFSARGLRTTQPLTFAARKTLLLSCSHVFHKTCLETFESFSESAAQTVCPVCRSLYSKKVLSTVQPISRDFTTVL